MELGRGRREFETLGRVTRGALDAGDPARMIGIFAQGLLDTFCLRSLVLAAVHPEEGFLEVVQAYPGDAGAGSPLGWRVDLSWPEVLCEVARTGKTDVIDGWDPRYYERVEEADGSFSFRQRPRGYNAGSTAFFVPILAEGRVLGVAATGSAQAERQIVLREIERMRPFLDQVGVALLEGVAAEAGVAVQNARLFEEVKAGREQLQALSQWPRRGTGRRR